MAGTRLATKRITTWLVCLTMLMSALLPSLGQALAPAGNDARLIELCSRYGTRLVLLETGEEPGTSQSGSSHCLWCSLYAGTFGTLPPVNAPLANVSPRVLILPLQAPDEASRPPFIWTTTAARGPPLFS